jgi:hypothetical protein
MSLLGAMFGYDERGNDLMGYPQDEQNACVVCGVAANAHTDGLTAECLQKLFRPARDTSQPTKTKQEGH